MCNCQSPFMYCTGRVLLPVLYTEHASAQAVAERRAQLAIAASQGSTSLTRSATGGKDAPDTGVRCGVADTWCFRSHTSLHQP